MRDLMTVDATVQCVRLTVCGDEESATLDLHDGESALVGAAAGCQLHLEDGSLAAHQCLIELKEGVLLLHNWSADGSTLVNGEAVEEGVVLEPTDRVSFGKYELISDFAGAPVENSPSASEQANSVPKRLEAKQVSPQSNQSESFYHVESVEASTVGILHAEIEFLQRELEQRDRQLAESQSSQGAEWDAPKSTALEKRNGELLDELDLADARRLSLMNELQALEELRAAEHEERQQLTVWVNEIEQLIAQREEELRAEMLGVQKKLEQERTQRLEEQKRADANASGTETVKDTLRKLRLEHEALREQLDEAKGLAHNLHKACRKLQAANTEAAIEKRVHEAVRQERLQLAQERAGVSRKEHLLIKKLREAEFLLERSTPVEAGPSVKEIRETIGEAAEPAKVSMAARLVEIWDRLDGPTDRD